MQDLIVRNGPVSLRKKDPLDWLAGRQRLAKPRYQKRGGAGTLINHDTSFVMAFSAQSAFNYSGDARLSSSLKAD
jgi:hypothetical protein